MIADPLSISFLPKKVAKIWPKSNNWVAYIFEPKLSVAFATTKGKSICGSIVLFAKHSLCLICDSESCRLELKQ